MADDTREKYILLAVNGTLMRGLELEGNLLEAGAEFGFEARTEKCYRLWSICDRNPAMIRVDPESSQAGKVDVEVWKVPAAGFVSVLLKEPEGLSVGKVKLDDGRVVLVTVPRLRGNPATQRSLPMRQMVTSQLVSLLVRKPTPR